MEKIIPGGAPAVVHGEKSDSVFIFVHGQGGSKDEARRFADVAEPLGFQVLAIDLPGHGERTDAEKFVPWEAVPELCAVMRYAKNRWKHISVRAISIGAWFSLLAFAGETIEKCLFSSPLLDMENMILSMMAFDGVTEERLRNEKEIVGSFGRMLSWDYLEWARSHHVHAIGRRTDILYATGDEMIPRETVDRFAAENNCRLTLYHGGQHWLHTDEELDFMKNWETAAIAENR